MANRFFVAGGVDNNWSTIGNWSLTSGGAGGQTVPSASDDVFLDGNSPNCTINTTTRNALSLTCTGYTNTLTFNAQLDVAGGNITLAAAMGLAGSSALRKATAGTLTSNGKAVSVPVILNGNVTYTLADNWNIDGTLTIGNSTTVVINGNTINIGGSFVTQGVLFNGTVALVFDGTGTWSGTARCENTGGKTINTAGTLTLSGTVIVGVTLTYTAGTVITAGATLRIANTATTLAIGGITLDDLAVGEAAAANNSTTTLSEDVIVGGDFRRRADTTGTINGNQIFVSGSYDGTFAAGIQAGTTEIVMAGTGSVTWDGQLRNPLTVDTAGTITFTGTLRYNAGTLKHTAGAVAWSAATFTVDVGTATVFDLDGLVLGANLNINAAGVILNLASDMEIDDSVALVFLGTAASPAGLRSNSGGTQRKFTVQMGTSIDIGYTNITDIDSDDGAEIHVFKGTISNSLNWTQITPFDAPLNLGGSPGPPVVTVRRSYGWVG